MQWLCMLCLNSLCSFFCLLLERFGDGDTSGLDLDEVIICHEWYYFVYFELCCDMLQIEKCDIEGACVCLIIMVT